MSANELPHALELVKEYNRAHGLECWLCLAVELCSTSKVGMCIYQAA